jgi:hypothetical protein
LSVDPPAQHGGVSRVFLRPSAPAREATSVQNHDRIGKFRRKPNVMSDPDHGPVGGLIGPCAEKADDFLRQSWIEICRRFVCENQIRVAGHRSGQGDSLPLPSRPAAASVAKERGIDLQLARQILHVIGADGPMCSKCTQCDVR